MRNIKIRTQINNKLAGMQQSQSSQYNRFFEGVAPIPHPSKQELQQHHITVLPDFPAWSRLRLVSVGYEGSIATYEVTLGYHCVTLRVLHASRPVGQCKDKRIASGGFSQIYEKALVSDKFVAKRIKFNGKANRLEIQMVIREAAIYILCSAFKIGPKFETNLPFAVICYEDAAEFHLQKCESFKTHFERARNLQLFQNQFRQRVFWLHQLHIIHKDIKPQNLLWSHYQNAYVLTDFGLSNCIKEVVGQPTSTYCEGTFKTMSPEMQRLNLVAEGGMVDLYFNDYWGVRVTLREAKKMSTVPISVEDLALSLELSEPGQSNQHIAINKSKSTDTKLSLNSYEYYEMYDRATSLQRHEFRLECWNTLSLVQKAEILNLLAKTNSTQKLHNFQRILDGLKLCPVQPELTELADRVGKRLENPQIYVESKGLVSKTMLLNYLRIFGGRETKLTQFLSKKQNDVQFDETQCRNYLLELYLRQLNKHLPSEKQWIESQKLNKTVEQARNTYRQIISHPLYSFWMKQFLFSNGDSQNMKHQFKYAQAQRSKAYYELMSSGVKTYGSQKVLEVCEELLQQFDPRSFQSGCLHLISAIFYFLTQKSKEKPTNHLRKCISILGRENCPHPPSLGVAKLFIDVQYDNHRDLRSKMREIIDYFDGTVDLSIDYIDRIIEISKNQQLPAALDFIKSPKYTTKYDYFQSLRECKMVQRLISNGRISKALELIRMIKKHPFPIQYCSQTQYGFTKILFLEAEIYFRMNMSADLQRCLSEIEEILKNSRANNKQTSSNYYLQKGRYYFMTCDYKRSLKFLTKSVEMLKQHTPKQSLDHVQRYQLIGTAYDRLGQYSKAVVFQDRAISLLKNRYGKFESNMARAYAEIAEMHAKNGQTKKSLYYCKLVKHAKVVSPLGFCYFVGARISQLGRDFQKALGLSWLSLQNQGLTTQYTWKCIDIFCRYYSKELAFQIRDFIVGEGFQPPKRLKKQIRPELYSKQDYSSSRRLPFALETKEFIRCIEPFLVEKLSNLAKESRAGLPAAMQLLRDNCKLVKVFANNGITNQKCYLVAIKLSIEMVLYWMLQSQWQLAKLSFKSVEQCLKKANQADNIGTDRDMLRNYADELHKRIDYAMKGIPNETPK